MKAFLWGVALTALAAAVAAALAVALGWVPVAATQHPAWQRWLLHTAYARRVEEVAEAVIRPASFGLEGQVLAGARAFDEMCSPCHRPPASGDTPVSAGLSPAPPRLTQLLHHLTPEQAFWVVKNGVRMTGMAAFGRTHSDEELWQLVSFLDAAQDLDAAGYQALLERARASGEQHQHRHHAGTAREVSSQRRTTEQPRHYH